MASTCPWMFQCSGKADPIADHVIADGTKLPVWQRAVQRSESVLGVGNGDGKAQPGEMIVIAARDGNGVRPVEVFTSDPCLDTSKRVSDPWGGYDNVGETAKYTVLLIAFILQRSARRPSLCTLPASEQAGACAQGTRPLFAHRRTRYDPALRGIRGAQTLEPVGGAHRRRCSRRIGGGHSQVI